MRNEQESPAETYQRFFGPAMFEPLSERLLRIAAPQPGERVLDLACGTGIVTRRLASAVGRSGRVVGVDLSPAMLAVAERLPVPDGVSVEWREGDAAALDLPDGAFDLALCQQGLQFVPDRLAAARELGRVLDDGGRAVVAVWNGIDHVPVFRAIIEAEAEHLGVPPETFATPFSLAERAELERIFDEAGFGSVEIGTEEIVARFVPADEFVPLTVHAAAAVMPELGEGGPDAVAALTRAVEERVGPVLQRYRDGDGLVFPMAANVAVARA